MDILRLRIIILKPLKFSVNPFFNAFYGRVLIFAFVNALFLKVKKFNILILNVSSVERPVIPKGFKSDINR